MPEPYGRRLPLSLPRRWVGDFLHFAQKVPTIPVQRRMNIAPLVAARNQAVPRPSWCALFTKAYAMVAARHPELRRTYLNFLRPCLYEHPVSVASIAVERRIGDENAVLFTQIRAPEEHTPEQLDSFLQDCKELPLERIGTFKRALRISRYPRPLRRLMWWLALNFCGYYRARNVGTFGVSVYSGLGAESLHPLSLMTTTLNYGVIAEDGTVDVRIIYDHRVLDGASIARALGELENVLNNQMPRTLVPGQKPGNGWPRAEANTRADAPQACRSNLAPLSEPGSHEQPAAR